MAVRRCARRSSCFRAYPSFVHFTPPSVVGKSGEPKDRRRMERHTSSNSSNASSTLSALMVELLFNRSIFLRFEIVNLTELRCSSSSTSRLTRVS